MSTDRESIFRRSGPTRFMFWLGSHLPPMLGMLVVWSVTGLLILLRPPIYDAAQQNLQHVMPSGTSRARLRWTLWRMLYYRTKGYYDFFHNAGRGIPVTRLNPPVRISSKVQRYISEAVHSGRGLLIIGTHTSNYDLCGCALGEYLPVPPLVLSIANPAPGLKFVNDLRSRSRGSLKPVSSGALREAVERLRAGGIVMTGVDRPLEEGNQPVTLFGSRALLPTGYIRIPLMTDCLVMTIACREKGGEYHIIGYPPMEMVRTPDREQDATVNLQRILDQVETLVRQAPDQWMVFVPVWPDGREGVEA